MEKELSILNNKNPRQDAREIIQEIGKMYEEVRDKIANENKEEMEKLQEMCLKELKIGKFLEIPAEKFPRLYQDPVLFRNILNKHGWTLLTTKPNEYRVYFSRGVEQEKL